MFFKQIKALVWKDITSELRTKEMVSAMLIFSFLVIVIFSFAFDPTRETTKAVFPGVIWVGFSFAAILGLNRSFVSEKANDSIMGLMLCPADRSVIYFGKVISNFLFVGIMELISLPVYFILFDYRNVGSLPMLVVVILLSTIGFISVGTLLAALSANTRTSEILLPIILFPIILPVIIAAVESTSIILGTPSIIELKSWLGLIIAYDIIFIAVPFVLFDYVLEV
ncbi:MAG: heme exporter protein CcmB [Bacillota bacterium]|nr:heme exporter protein CcmB [Bacillota bacterium]